MGFGPRRRNLLFVCGTADTALLCTRPYALESADYVVDASYTYKQERNAVYDAISIRTSAHWLSQSYVS